MFALPGIRRRSWWVGIGVFALLSLPLLALWPDYLRVALNSSGSLTYALLDFPIMLAPLAAWLGRRREPPPAKMPKLRVITSAR